MEIGEYVRTKDGFIAKLVSKNDYLKKYCFDNYIWEKGYMPISDISYQLLEKHIREDIEPSPNIIDLIEVGDYVNGVLVTTRMIDNLEMYFNEIKSIVTKERFKEMEYKL